MRALPQIACFLLSALLLAVLPAGSPAQAAEARIGDFRFECRTPDGKRLKPKHGDINGAFFVDLPAQRDACLDTVDRMMAWCRDNTVFISNTMNEEYSACLPIFRTQAQECAAFFRNERPKCDAGGTGQASLGETGAAPDPWSDAGSTGGGSVWDPPAEEAEDPWGPANAQRAGLLDVASEDERRKREEAQRILAADARRRQDASGAASWGTAQDDYAGALAVLEKREAENRLAAETARREAELEVKREAALRAERKELREIQEREAERRLRAQREAEYQAARAARRANHQALMQMGNSLMQQGTALFNQQQEAAARSERRRQAEARERQRQFEEQRRREQQQAAVRQRQLEEQQQQAAERQRQLEEQSRQWREAQQAARRQMEQQQNGGEPSADRPNHDGFVSTRGSSCRRSSRSSCSVQ